MLSTDLYKIYHNDSLDRLIVTKGRFHINEICCDTPICADDTAAGSDFSVLAEDYGELELVALLLEKCNFTV